MLEFICVLGLEHNCILIFRTSNPPKLLQFYRNKVIIEEWTKAHLPLKFLKIRLMEGDGDEDERREQKRWIYKTGILNVRRSKLKNNLKVSIQ